MTVKVWDNNNARMAFGWFMIAVVVTAWTSLYYFFPYLAGLAAVIHIVCILGDAGMNGMQNAEWVPFNLVGLTCAVVGSTLAGGLS